MQGGERVLDFIGKVGRDVQLEGMMSTRHSVRWRCRYHCYQRANVKTVYQFSANWPGTAVLLGPRVERWGAVGEGRLVMVLESHKHVSLPGHGPGERVRGIE